MTRYNPIHTTYSTLLCKHQKIMHAPSAEIPRRITRYFFIKKHINAPVSRCLWMLLLFLLLLVSTQVSQYNHMNNDICIRLLVFVLRVCYHNVDNVYPYSTYASLNSRRIMVCDPSPSRIQWPQSHTQPCFPWKTPSLPTIMIFCKVWHFHCVGTRPLRYIFIPPEKTFNGGKDESRIEDAQ